MFELTWQAQLINLVTAFVVGAGWTLGCWVMTRLIAAVFSNRQASPANKG